MKYQLTSAKPAQVAKKVFDFNAAVEALTESLDKLPSSYAALSAAEQLVADAECALADCQTAMESISKYGLTAQNMSLLNGAEHGLDRALGLEDLAIESLASLSESTKTMLQKQYTAGLEGKTAEIFKGLVERVKAFFAKLIQWLKDLFTGNAQIIKIVQEIAKSGIGELDGDKKVTAYSKEVVTKTLEGLGTLTTYLQDVAAGKEGSAEDAVNGGLDKYGAMPEKESKTVKELGWDAAALKTAAEKFVSLASKADVATAWNKIQADYKSAIAGSGEDPKKVEELKAKFKAWLTAQKCTAAYSKIVRQMGLTIVTISKAAKKAAEPAK